MKKELPTAEITHELAQSVFFPKRATERANDSSPELTPTRTPEHPPALSPEQVNAPTSEPANDRTPERSPLPSPVQGYERMTAHPNGRTDNQSVRREKTERYSFEIYPSQKECIEEYLYLHKRQTKEKISASQFIRTAIDYYFKTLK